MGITSSVKGRSQAEWQESNERVGKLSAKNTVNHPSVHVSQTDIAASKSICELLVIQSQKPEDRGMEIVNLRHIFD